jgi:hypothetical protein
MNEDLWMELQGETLAPRPDPQRQELSLDFMYDSGEMCIPIRTTLEWIWRDFGDHFRRYLC